MVCYSCFHALTSNSSLFLFCYNSFPSRFNLKYDHMACAVFCGFTCDCLLKMLCYVMSIKFERFFATWVSFCVLCIISISKINIVLTQLNAEIWEHIYITKDRYNGSRKQSNQTIRQVVNKPPGFVSPIWNRKHC